MPPLNTVLYTLREQAQDSSPLTPLTFTPANSGTITATVRDPHGALWSNAIVSAVFKPSPFGNGEPTWTGGPIPTPIITTTDSGGYFTLTLPASSSITPSGSQWAISICPNASFACTVINIAVTPGTIDLSAFITTQIDPNDLHVNAFPVPRVYDVEEARGNPPLNFGALVANTTAGVIQYWDGAEWQTLGTNTGSGFVELSPPASQVIVQPPGTVFSITSDNTNIDGAFNVTGPADSAASTTGPSMVSLRVGLNSVTGELTPGIEMVNQSGPADNHFADIVLYEGGQQFRFSNDSGSVVLPWLNVNRDGGTATNAAFSCSLIADDTMTAYGTVSALDFGRSNVNLRAGQAPNAPTVAFINTDGGVDSKYADIVNYPGGMQFRFSNDAETTVVPWMSANRSGANPTDVTVFANFDVTGTKNFKIPHPLNADYDLIHSCVEGPEAAVFYRGESQTHHGTATITLPDYFEALTRLEDRTVQLTALFEDDHDDIGFLAAGRVVDGKFKVRSTVSSQRFYWEVKAVRADVPELVVEKLR